MLLSTSNFLSHDRGMTRFLTPIIVSCLFWAGLSSDVLVYYAVHKGLRFGNVSQEFRVETFDECHVKCLRDNPSLACLAFNFRVHDRSCQLIHNERSDLVPSKGYQAHVQCESKRMKMTLKMMTRAVQYKFHGLRMGRLLHLETKAVPFLLLLESKPKAWEKLLPSSKRFYCMLEM